MEQYYYTHHFTAKRFIGSMEKAIKSIIMEGDNVSAVKQLGVNHYTFKILYSIISNKSQLSRPFPICS